MKETQTNHPQTETFISQYKVSTQAASYSVGAPTSIANLATKSRAKPMQLAPRLPFLFPARRKLFGSSKPSLPDPDIQSNPMASLS